jgi:hypothetical protein
MVAFVGAMKMQMLVNVPGKVTEAVNFRKTEKPGVVTLELTGAKILEAVDRVMQDDAIMAKAVRSGQKPMQEPSDQANEIAFGQKGPVRATVAEMKPQFDYAAEVAAAQAAYPEMMTTIGLASVAAVPPATGEGLKSLSVGGVRLVWDDAGGGNERPFNYPKGYTLALIGRFGGQVLDVSEGQVLTAVADNGDSLLPQREWDRKIHFPKLSEDGRTVGFDAELRLPGSGVKGLREVSGTLTCSTASGTRDVDFGLTAFTAGTKGPAEYGAVIESVQKSQWGKGQELTLTLRPPPEVKEFRFTDANGAVLAVERSVHVSDDQQISYTFQCEQGFPAKGRIVMVVYEVVKVFEIRWKVENVTLLGRPKE